MLVGAETRSGNRTFGRRGDKLASSGINIIRADCTLVDCQLRNVANRFNTRGDTQCGINTVEQFLRLCQIVLRRNDIDSYIMNLADFIFRLELAFLLFITRLQFLVAYREILVVERRIGNIYQINRRSR